MKRKQDWLEKRQSLRSEAELTLAGVSPNMALAKPNEVLLHELLVHKVELEMQIDELQRSHKTMQEARDRYLDLYDYSPVAYITLSQDGLIREINLNGAELLGGARIELINHRFSTFISMRERERWNELCLRIFEQANHLNQFCNIEMTRSDGSTFHAYIAYRRVETDTSAPVVRLVLIDISQLSTQGH